MKVAHLLILIIFFGCSRSPRNANNNRGEIESFDIAPDDANVLLLSNSSGTTSVIEMNLEGLRSKRILTSLAGEILSSPRYSPDGKRILFIKYKRENFSESVVYVCDSNGSNMLALTNGDELITEAIFSAKGNAVLYCSSKKYKKYNKSRTKTTTETRKFDIYVMNINDRNETQLTNLNAVGIDHLSEINERYVLFHLTAGKKSGIFSFDKDHPEKVMRIFPVNVAQDANGLVNPGYAPDRFLVFGAHSELYAMDMNSQMADLIYDTKGGHLIHMLRGFHTKSSVLLKKFDELTLTSINTNGSDVRVINIEFPE